jgi:hypothetical protein
MFPRERAGDFIGCACDYQDICLDLALSNVAIADPGRLRQIDAMQAQAVGDIRTQDKAQGMIARMIGAEKARRIFYEVTT